ncbi:hypothetical protein L3Q82_025904, partial [Scortum barcoo]
PAPLFRLGSDLKVYCHIAKCVPRSKISLDVNGKTVDSWTRVNCTTAIFNLFNVRVPRSIVLCKLKRDHDKMSQIVNGLDLFGGLIPETPLITLVEFGNNSRTATLHWKATESSEHLKSSVRLRTSNGSWEEAKSTELKEGLIQVDGLKPLTEYEFQMQTCDFISGLTNTHMPRLASSRRPHCSEWSPCVRGSSPGKGKLTILTYHVPKAHLHVWRMSGSLEINGQRVVTVLWKPPSREDYSGEVQQYKIFLGGDQKQEATCLAALSQCSVLVPAELQALSISAITSYGESPPADLPLRNSGDSGPVLRELAPAANGSGVFISWLWPDTKNYPTCGEMLHYVLEWTTVPAEELQWQKLAKDQSNTSITGLSAGVRYSVALYAVTTRGVRAPSSGLVYSKEQKPASAPKMSVLIHVVRRILIQWDELPVEQQRGFITNYTIYLQTLDTSNTELKVMVPGSGPRQRWLNCPEGALALQLSASTSAGEGRRGHRITSQPAVPAVGLVIVLVFIATFFIAIIANLLCWSCVRKRIKQKCVSWGPAWFHENLPKLGNSNAIKLLEQDGSEVSLSPTYSDPPLSPINLISEDERDDVYPTIQIDTPQVSSGQPAAETPLLMSYPGTTLDHVCYKPQVALLGANEEEVMETEEEQRDVEEEDRCSSVFGGLQGGFLSSVEVDFSDLPLGLTLSSVNGLWWPKTPETTNVLGTENDVEADSPSLDPQPGEIMTSSTEDTRLSQYTLETTLTGGYFPQLAVVSSTTLCDTQR